ncbi:P-loop containing nucleoside triphosphate hydrolase protein [Choiromyces venosus 120613-1]|uniref:P-loop containing nucleoside triphosphate hydrolase protein n=1 Tax=Choiromyces venosus 120613-1 TaxID=1336337 RepID=A0A3N4J3Y6_9PEZI|nr:P-loop containing nucleoside triphosphate hydrolase protein [Choiromyces venosus 120613-1]
MDLVSASTYKYGTQSPPYQEHHQQLGGFHPGDTTTPTPPTRNSSFPPESSAMAEARARNYQNGGNNNSNPQHNNNNIPYHNSENGPEESPSSRMQTANETFEPDDCAVQLVPVPDEPVRITNGGPGPEGDKRSSSSSAVVARKETEPMIIESGPVSMDGIDPIQEQLRREGGEGGLNVLGGGMREMVDLVNRLRASGIEDLGLPLPRIAVVGNQSAGKSSLIEAISGIKVPRYTGTCTRCPLEINLRESSNPIDPWHCRISLRFKKRYNPSLTNSNNHHMSTSRTRGNPWVDQATEQVHFLDITNKDQVEPALVRAQRAILTPGQDWRDFVNEEKEKPTEAGAPETGNARGNWLGHTQRAGGVWGSSADNKGKGRAVETRGGRDEDFEVKFSPNVVCMEITGPELPNLAFIDLPGVIQTTESESEHYLIELVTGLVREYVREEDCLIMLAMTMKDDAVNQSAARLARELGEERTIGALTKPDTVGPGEYGQWINILRGHSHRLKHGYFVTKQPNQEQLVQGITHAQAREQEAEFFANTEPWKTELTDLKERFGTMALQSYLSKELGELIKKRLPEIIGSIKGQAAEVQEELAALPPPPTDNQTLIVHNLVTQFDNFVGGHLLGGPGQNEFQQELRRLAEDFQRRLKALRPTPVYFQTIEQENEIAAQLETPRKGEAGTRSHRWDRDGSPTLGVVTRRGRKAGGAGVEKSKRASGTAGNNTAIEQTHRLTLPQIRHIIESTATARIPGQVDPTAITNLIRQSINLWNPVVHEFLNNCGGLMNRQVHYCFTLIFKEYQKSPIFQGVYEILNTLVQENFDNQKIVIDRLWRLETEQISTLNEDYQTFMANHHEKLSDRRKRNLEDQRSRAAANAAAEAALNEDNAGGPNGGGGSTPSPRKKRNPATNLPAAMMDNSPDPYRKEIEVLAQVRAYNEVAQKRFVDNVYMSIQGELVNGFRKSILEALQSGLGLNGPDVSELCTQLLVEDPLKERRRKELQSKSEQLDKAMEELSRL